MFLKTLNPVQLSAATFGDGPLLVLAGAGSGKTKVLTSRVAHLVLNKGVRPEEIVAVTFTNKAAGEMRERLYALIGDKAARLWLGTFHSIGLRILRAEKAADASLTVYNDDDQLSLVKQVMSELGINEKAFSPRAMLTRIDQAKNEEVGPDQFALDAADFFSERVAKVYALYQKRLKEMGCMDFGDLICGPIRLLRENPALLNKYQSRFRHLLVDEYQDTNRAQYVFTQMLSGGTKNLLAVGDPDQSIYAWRGARIDNILDFEKDYPDAAVIRLEQNYRSTKHILSAANSVIRKNLRRMEKDLWTENWEGMPVVFEETPDEYGEARAVIKRIKDLLNGSALRHGDIAVFYRTNAQSRVFEELLIREGIPYAIVGGTRFYDRKEIRDAVAYLRCVANSADALSFQRVINTPARGIGKAALDKINAISVERGLTLFDALKAAVAEGILQQRAKAHEFINAVEAFKGASETPNGQRTLLDADAGAAGGKGRVPALHERTLKLLEDSGYMRMLQEENTEEALERIENLFEFISAIKDFELANPDGGLAGFLDHTALISDLDSYEDKSDALTLMTLHSAKGLEFKAVFITGMEEGLFPHSRSADDEDELEEERRLCYVGMTRAKERLFLHCARSRTVYGESRYKERSRFIDEISSEHIEHIEAPGKRFAARSKPLREPNEVYYTSEDSQTCGLETDENPDTAVWRIGMKVKHPSFGLGVVKERSGSGDDIKLTIRFFNAGVKKLAIKYAYLTPVGE